MSLSRDLKALRNFNSPNRPQDVVRVLEEEIVAVGVKARTEGYNAGVRAAARIAHETAESACDVSLDTAYKIKKQVLALIKKPKKVKR